MAKKFTVKDMVLCSLLAAMTGILSQIGIPIGEIPINLALFSVYLAGGLLGSYKGAVSMVVYIMMGAVGLPVFSNFRGGLSVLAGPTGGYILGYLFAGINIMLVGYFSATDRALQAFVVSILRGALAIAVCAIIMSKIWGMNGIWLSFLASEIIAFLVILITGRPKASAPHSIRSKTQT